MAKRRDIVSGYILQEITARVVSVPKASSTGKRYKIPSEQVDPHSFQAPVCKEFSGEV